MNKIYAVKVKGLSKTRGTRLLKVQTGLENLCSLTTFYIHYFILFSVPKWVLIVLEFIIV